MIRRAPIWILAAALSPLPAGAFERPQPRELGVGVMVGDPVGLNGRYWFGPRHALDVGVGFSGDPALYAAYAWHSWDVFKQPKEGLQGGYLSLGGRFEEDFGLRSVAGIEYGLEARPLSLFMEAGPVFVFDDRNRVDVDLLLGFRWYFAKD